MQTVITCLYVENKQQHSAKNISKSSEGNPRRNIRCLHPTLRPACDDVPQLSGAFRSRALYCPSVMYLPDTHSLINVRSDLLNLFSFLLTVILFPQDRPDGVHVCVPLNVCVAAPAGFEKGKKKKGRGRIPTDKIYTGLSTYFINHFLVEGKKKKNRPTLGCQAAGILMSGLTDQCIQRATTSVWKGLKSPQASRVNIGHGLAGLLCQINICK